MKKYEKTIIILLIAVLAATIFAFVGRTQIKPELTLELQSPSFVLAASAGSVESAPTEVRAMLSEEAGISAYMQTSGPIDLSQIRGLYRTIEMETSTYIIGSVDVPNYAEYWDVHVYAHTDGWILGYYLNTDDTSKIVDVRSETLSTTLLENAVSIIAATIGDTTTNLKYYDFRFPNATNILLVGEDDDDGSDFTITLPSEYIYYERSWVKYNSLHSYVMKIDGVSQPETLVENSVNYGPIYSTTLILDEPHHVDLNTYGIYGAIAITYRIP